MPEQKFRNYKSNKFCKHPEAPTCADVPHGNTKGFIGVVGRHSGVVTVSIPERFEKLGPFHQPRGAGQICGWDPMTFGGELAGIPRLGPRMRNPAQRRQVTALCPFIAEKRPSMLRCGNLRF